MKVYFGVNEYELINFAENGDSSIDFRIIGDEVDLGNFEEVITNKSNTSTITVIDNELQTVDTFEGFTKVINLQKEYDVIYAEHADDTVLIPAVVDPETGEVIQPAILNSNNVEERADIIFLRLSNGNLVNQVDQNAANIEYIAIMSDIEL